MTIRYYRWIRKDSADLISASAKHPKLTSQYMKKDKLVHSESALWVFRMDDRNYYRPRTGISSDRQLHRITFLAEGEAIMESHENHVNFTRHGDLGESGYPTKILTKENELGARGIGETILQYLNAKIDKIVPADDKELKKALE